MDAIAISSLRFGGGDVATCFEEGHVIEDSLAFRGVASDAWPRLTLPPRTRLVTRQGCAKRLEFQPEWVHKRQPEMNGVVESFYSILRRDYLDLVDLESENHGRDFLNAPVGIQPRQVEATLGSMRRGSSSCSRLELIPCRTFQERGRQLNLGNTFLLTQVSKAAERT